MLIHVPRRLAPSHWGGTERVLEQTIPELKSLGIEQKIFTSKALESNEASQLGEIHVRRFDYSYSQWPLSSEKKKQFDLCGGNLLSQPLEAALLKTPNLALIHCHTGNRLAGQCLKVAEKRNLPSIITLHGGHFAVPHEERIQKESAGQAHSLSLNWGKVWSAYYRTRNVLKRASAIICVGAEEYNAARLALPQQSVHLLPGGVDLLAFSRGEAKKGSDLLGLPEGEPYLVSIARIDAQKDQLTLVKALRTLSEPPFLALVGPETTPGYADELRRSAQGTPLAQRLLLPGPVSPAAVPHLLAGAILSVLPSVHEPFGLSVVEAWAAGTPLIASNVGGPGELLKGQVEGLLFESGNAEELRGKIQSLLTDANQRESLKQAGLKKVTQYSWRKRGEKLLSIYAEVGLRLNNCEAA